MALISGGARGIGAATARAMVAEGACVVIGDLLEDVAFELAEALGENASAVRLDVVDPASWDSAVAHATDRFGALHVLVNNAGTVHRLASIENIGLETWNRVMDVNVTGVFNGICAALPAMKASGGGSIINISSIAGVRATNGIAPYAASKFAVRGLTKAAAMDLGRFGIRVNSVHPGLINTAMAAGVDYPMTHLPISRIGQPEEIANLILFLASDESSFSTGAEFVADAGDLAGHVLI